MVNFKFKETAFGLRNGHPSASTDFITGHLSVHWQLTAVPTNALYLMEPFNDVAAGF